MSGKERVVSILPAGSHPVKDNRVLLRGIQDDMYKMCQDMALVKMDLKIILAKIEAAKEMKAAKEDIKKGWFFG